MTEVGRDTGFLAGMVMAERNDPRALRGAWARLVRWPEGDSGTADKGGASPRETVTALPAPVTLWQGANIARFAPQLGAGVAKLLGSAVVMAPSCGKIAQKIIGRGRRSRWLLLRRFRSFYRRSFALAILHQPSRQHGGRILLDPLIDQRGDLLAQIRSVAEPRQFVTLQAVTRSGQQKLPRRRNSAAGHETLLGREERMHSNAAVPIVKR